MSTPVPAASPQYPPLPAPPAGAAPGRRRVCIASFDFVGPVKNGGVGTAFTSLGEALAAAGHDVTLLFLAGQWCENRTLPDWIEHYRAKGIRFVPLPDSGLRINGRWHVNKAYEGYLWLKDQDFDVIHFSEWKGTGYFALRAKRQGLAFARTTLCVHTHGPTLWHKLSNGEYVTELDDVELDYLERCSVELADVLASPSRYLLGWMRQRGWVLPERTHVQQYVRPATARAPRPGADRVHRVGELVFFGRLEVRKGLVLFCDALDQLAADPATRHARVTFLGKVDQVDGRDSIAYISDRAAGWPWRCEVINDRDQQGAMDYLQGEGRLAVIPSLVDNLPNTVLECLGAQVPFLASEAGGIPEMIAEADLAATCFPLHAGCFAARLRRALAEGVRPARHAVEQAENERAWAAWHGLPAVVAPESPAGGPAPLVSVCLSHWNRPAYLRQALASLAAQDHPRLEVVLVDDGSTEPESRALLGQLEPDFAARGWQLLRNEENRYPGAARNRAARAARGDFLFFMDDDNCAKPHEVSTLLAVARRTGADVVTCCLDTFSGHDAPVPGARPDQRWLFIGDDAATGAFRNCFGDTNGLWRRAAFARAGGFHEDWGVGHEDWELLGRAVLRGLRLEVVPEALAWYRYNQREATVNRNTPPQANHLANIRPYLEALPPNLRTLVAYAQGMHVRRAAGSSPVEQGSTTAFIQHTVAWRGSVQAAVQLAHHHQGQAAAQVLLGAVQALEECPLPNVVLDALLEIGPRLGLLDAPRARALLEVAMKLAVMARRGGDVVRIREMITQLPSPRPASPQPARSGRVAALAGR